MSVGLAAFASLGPLPGPPLARPLAAPVASQAQRVHASRTRKTRKPWMIFARGWQLGLECLQEGGLKQLSGGPCPLHTPPRLIPATSFVLSSASFPLSPSRHLPVLPLFAEARLPCGVVVGPVGPGTTCWPQEGLHSRPKRSSPERY